MEKQAIQKAQDKELFVTFRKSNFKKEKYLYEAFQNDLVYGFDDYYEHLIVDGDVISILNGPDTIGVCSIFDGILTCLHVMDHYLDDYKTIIERIIEEFHIHQITFSSNDINMSLYIKEYDYRIEHVAVNYSFHTYKSDIESMYKASHTDMKEIQETFGDFHDDDWSMIPNHTLLIHYRNRMMVAMVHTKQHKINDTLYSLGVIVVEDFRRKTIAKNCLAYVGNSLIKKGKKVHSGCSYTDYKSRSMLEKAGFVLRSTLSNVYLP